MKNLITKSLQDILSKDILVFILKIGVLSITISIAIVWTFWDSLTATVSSFLGWVPWEWLQGAGAGIVNILLAYILFIIIVSLLTSLMSEGLLKKLIKKHYPSIQAEGSPDIKISVWLTLKATLIFLALFVIAIPLLFVPVVGQVVMLYLWSILIKEPTLYDVTSLINRQDTALDKKSTILAMIASLFNYIPIINLFAPVFAQILFLHFVLSSKSLKSRADHR